MDCWRSLIKNQLKILLKIIKMEELAALNAANSLLSPAPAVSPVPASSGSSTAQIATIIILVVIGIVLFVIFLVFFVNIPLVTVQPFGDGTQIKLKALTNNLYLVPVSCSSISPSCISGSFQGACSSPSNNIVAAFGNGTEPESTWTLCLYSSNTTPPAPANSGEAIYYIYNTASNGSPNVMVLNNGVLSVQSIGQICKDIKASPISCTADTNGVLNFADKFSFLLNELNNTKSTTSGSYQIALSCDINTLLFCDGQGFVDPTQGCVPFVVVDSLGEAKTGCASSSSPRCALNYLFEIEVVGKAFN